MNRKLGAESNVAMVQINNVDLKIIVTFTGRICKTLMIQLQCSRVLERMIFNETFYIMSNAAVETKLNQEQNAVPEKGEKMLSSLSEMWV